MPTAGLSRRKNAEWASYANGSVARERHVPFSKNPYKSPKTHTNWALGWLDQPRVAREVKRRQKARARR